MARMNWDRARREYQAAQRSSYGDREAAAEEAWVLRDAEYTARREARARTGLGASDLSKAQRQSVGLAARELGLDLSTVRSAYLTQLFVRLDKDAKRHGIDPGELRRRRLKALKQRYSVDAILKAGRLDQAPVRRRRRNRTDPPPPTSMKQRLQQEAARLGVSVQEVASGQGPAPAPTRPSGASSDARLIKSSGYGSPKPKPARKPSPRSKAVVSTPLQKSERDRRAAAKLGITVPELKAMRRAEHQANTEKRARGRAATERRSASSG